MFIPYFSLNSKLKQRGQGQKCHMLLLSLGDFTRKSNNKKRADIVRVIYSLFSTTDSGLKDNFIWTSNRKIAELSRFKVGIGTVKNAINDLIHLGLMRREVITKKGHSKRILSLTPGGDTNNDMLRGMAFKNPEQAERGFFKKIKGVINFDPYINKLKRKENYIKKVKKPRKKRESLANEQQLAKVPEDIREFCRTHNIYPAFYLRNPQLFRDTMAYVLERKDSIRTIGPYFLQVYKAPEKEKTYNENKRISNIFKGIPKKINNTLKKIPKKVKQILTPEAKLVTSGPVTTHSPLVVMSLMAMGFNKIEQEEFLKQFSPDQLETYFQANKRSQKAEFLQFATNFN